DFLDKKQRYARANEFLEIVRRLWTGDSVNFDGEYLSVDNAVLHQIPDPLPQIYFGGSSPEGIAVSAKHADVYLTWGEPPEAVAEKISRVRAAAAAQG
ncbi:LLM class flavin-dependent oxidoreductase, partial [Mycobacterium tuberculosis]|uniref:LLM class flavin-dependent oxidoreductase n=1 Tax=Mycobacterium tuberculosis TaxID=1773 RepID=UPI001AE7CB6A|nr:LLM class flavin-dependent oxidoreductase [Mycobacterium tuberculosis]